MKNKINSKSQIFSFTLIIDVESPQEEETLPKTNPIKRAKAIDFRTKEYLDPFSFVSFTNYIF
jgi:hypothetical protein